MATIELDIAEFRAKFPAYADVVKYPDELIQSTYDTATCYISDQDYGLPFYRMQEAGNLFDDGALAVHPRPGQRRTGPGAGLVFIH